MPGTEVSSDQVFARLQDKSALIGVIGLGYVGLPLCLAFGEAGAKVLGFDVDPSKPDAIANGRTYLKQFSSERIAKLHGARMLSATSDMGRLGEPDALLICVPTPLTRHLEPDLSFVTKTAEAIAACLRPGQIVVLESTTYPGTTVEVVKPILERGGLKAGVDFWLAFSPEREDPGNEAHTTTTIPKIVGADDEVSRKLACAVYDTFSARTVPVSSSATAEAVKITENVFRAVNIALVNELKLLYEAMGVDIWEVIDAAKTKPFGFMPFYPGPGLGGHCIPIDPFYLTWKAREVGMATRFIELAGQINSDMPQHVTEKLALALDMRLKKGLNGTRILMLGVAYKKNVDDMRESPALRLIELIEARGASVDFYDPFVPSIPPSRDHASLAGRRSVPWSNTMSRDYDATLIVTDHDGVDYASIVESAAIVVDTRNVCRRAGVMSSKVVLA